MHKPDSTLFDNLTLAQFEKLCKTAVASIGTQNFSFTPHVCRHVGPSFDMYVNRWSLHDVQVRGRWLSPESVRRYAKFATYVRQVAKLTQQQIASAAEICARLPTALANKLSRF